MRHRLGTPVSQDEAVFHESDETFLTFVYKSKSKNHTSLSLFLLARRILQTLASLFIILENNLICIQMILLVNIRRYPLVISSLNIILLLSRQLFIQIQFKLL